MALRSTISLPGFPASPANRSKPCWSTPSGAWPCPENAGRLARMRIVFDQGTPAPPRRALSGHSVATAFELGWSGFANGDLLKQGEAQFDLLITTDQNLRYEQNL